MGKFLSRTGLLIICAWLLAVAASAADMLIPVGQVVGLELGDNTVTVAAFHEDLGTAAEKAINPSSALYSTPRGCFIDLFRNIFILSLRHLV